MNKSYFKFLRIIVAIAWYGVAAAGVFMVAVLTFMYFDHSTGMMKLTFDIPVRLNNDQVLSEPGWVGSVSSAAHSLLAIDSFAAEPTALFTRLYITTALSVVIGISLFMLMLNQLRQLVGTLGTTSVFSMANVIRIRLLGGLLIGTELIKPLAWWLIRDDVLTLLNRHQIKFTGESVTLGLSSLSVVGLLVLGLAEVFRSGYQLQVEQDLTI